MLVDNLQYEAPLAKSDHFCLFGDVAEVAGRNVKLDFWKGRYNEINRGPGTRGDWLGEVATRLHSGFSMGNLQIKTEPFR